MSQEIGLQTIQPRLGTRDAIGHHNEPAYEFNRRCKAHPYGEGDGEEATRFIDSASRLQVENMRQLTGRETAAIERGRIELVRMRASKLNIDVLRNGEQSRSTFQVTEDLLQEFWIYLPAPLPADLEALLED